MTSNIHLDPTTFNLHPTKEFKHAYHLYYMYTNCEDGNTLPARASSGYCLTEQDAIAWMHKSILYGYESCDLGEMVLAELNDKDQCLWLDSVKHDLNQPNLQPHQPNQIDHHQV